MSDDEVLDSYEVRYDDNIHINQIDNNIDTTNDVLGVNEEVVVKKRRVFAKLDENRLLSAHGISAFRSNVVKKFKLRGKGHEREDLANLLGGYQLWAHSLFPKANFADFIQMCKKAGSTRTIKMYRRQWLEEEKTNGARAQEQENNAIRIDDDDGNGKSISHFDSGESTTSKAGNVKGEKTNIRRESVALSDDDDDDNLFVGGKNDSSYIDDFDNNDDDLYEMPPHVDDEPEDNSNSIWNTIARDAMGRAKSPAVNNDQEDDDVIEEIHPDLARAKEMEDQRQLEAFEQEELDLADELGF